MLFKFGNDIIPMARYDNTNLSNEKFLDILAVQNNFWSFSYHHIM